MYGTANQTEPHDFQILQIVTEPSLNKTKPNCVVWFGSIRFAVWTVQTYTPINLCENITCHPQLPIMFLFFWYRTKEFCDGVNTTNYLSRCGRAMGLDFYYLTGRLFITDASLGLFSVGPFGGPAKLLASGADGIPFRFCVGLDVHQETGLVYFTDASISGGVDQIQYIVEIADATGRVMVYNQIKKKVTILVNGLSGAASVAVSKDGYYLMLAEFIGNRIRRYWLKGPRAGTLEILRSTPGTPDNIKRTNEGDFWVAITSPTGQPQGIRIDGNATTLETITFSPYFEPTFLAEVLPYKGSLYLGSLSGLNLGIYTPDPSWSSM